MAAYLVAVTDNIENVLKIVEERWPDRYYYLEPNLVFISVEGISSPAIIKEKLGVSLEEDTPSGLILRLNGSTSAGVLPKAAIDWYKVAIGE